MSDLLDFEPRTAGPRPKRRGGLVVAIAAIVLISLVVAGVFALKGLVGPPKITDYSGQGTEDVTITIDRDSSISEIGRVLQGAGVIATVSAFVDAAGTKTIAPGTYLMKKQMPAALALSYLLSNAHRQSLHVVVPEGFEADQVLQAIAKTGKITMADLRAAVRKPAALKLPDYANGHVEGLLFPATYDFAPGTTAEQALAQMVERFGEASKSVNLELGSAQVQHTPYEVLIVASIIVREAKNLDEYERVARVIYNRLDKGMPLQMDSTLNYTKDVKKLHLSLDDIADPTPYNTYLHKGLPPTPISNPGEAALHAALNPANAPADRDLLYFVSFPDGTTQFAKTYKEFVKLKASAGLSGPQSHSATPSSASSSAAK